VGGVSDADYRTTTQMAFSIKQLLFGMAVVAFGLVALLNSRPILGKLFDLLTLGILIATAYGAWISHGESRAFRIGFLCWAVLYFALFKKTFDVGIHELVRRAYDLVQPTAFTQSPFFTYHANFNSVFHSLFLLLLGLVGGYVTVYFYRKRQRMLNKK
jgi:hypothetical protein